MTDLLQVSNKLKKAGLLDLGQLKPGGRREVKAELARIRKLYGLVGYVLVTKAGDNLKPWRAVWKHLGASPRTELLLLYNGQRWEARGWGLTARVVETTLDQAEHHLKTYKAKGLVQALRALAAASGPGTESAVGKAHTRDSNLPWLLGGACGVATLGGALMLGWIFNRRSKRDAEASAHFDSAMNDANAVFADVVLKADALALEFPDTSDDILQRVQRLRDELAGIEAKVAANPELKSKRTTLGQVEHLENELRVLNSRILQMSRR